MTAADAFLTAIIENPGDDTPRLIFADWLEEHGEEERTEFIRVQIKLAGFPTVCPGCNRGHESGVVLAIVCDACERQDALRRREKELLVGCVYRLTSPSESFLAPPRDWQCKFRRGFVAEITLTCADWLQHRERLLKAAPLERVTLTQAYFGVIRPDKSVRVYPAPEGRSYHRVTLCVRGGELWTVDGPYGSPIRAIPTLESDDRELYHAGVMFGEPAI